MNAAISFKSYPVSACNFLLRPRIWFTPESGASEWVFRPGSTSAAAILFDSFELYERKSPRADENIRNIRPELASAVDTCVQAAGHELEPYWQKRLLNVRDFFPLFETPLAYMSTIFNRPRFMGVRSLICTTRPTWLKWDRPSRSLMQFDTTRLVCP